MRLPARSVAAGALAALLIPVAVPAGGQERPEGPRVFTGETQVLAVEVPVQVLLDGEPVRGLNADDFRIYEGGELRPLTGFEVVDLTVAAGSSRPGTDPPSASDHGGAPALDVPPAGRRHFLLFFDLAFTEAGHVSKGLGAARSLVREGLHPSDLVGVAFYTSRQGVGLALQFTPDRSQVERVLDAFEFLLDGKKELPPEVLGDLPAARRASDPLGLTAGGFGATLVEVGRAAGYQTSDFAETLAIVGGTGSGWGGFLMNNILYHSAAFMEQAYEEQRSAQAAYLADNLKALAEALRGIQGPKHLVLLSQGFDGGLLEVGPGDSEVGSGGGGWLLSVMNRTIAELRRSGWVIHGADLGGLADTLDRGFAAATKSSLFFLAEETGGVLVENANDLAAGLDEVLERTSVTYVLTFQAKEVREDGSFHPIRIELVDGPRAARLVHRAGYHAPRPAAERHPFERQAAAAALLLAGEEVSGLPARLLATALDYHDGRARVPVLVEVAGRELLGRRGSDGAATEIYVYAFDASGAVADFFAKSVTLPAAPEEGAGAPLRGVKLTGSLDLPPGRYDLRALVRGPGGGHEAVRSATLDVPESAGGPRLLPPLFVAGVAERWVVAELGEEGGAYPFTVEGQRIAPAAVPVLAPGETARLLLPGVGIAAPDVRLATRIVDEAGRTANAGRLEILGRRPPEAGQPDLLVARFDPSGLAPGAYALEVAVAGGGGETVRARFRVGS